MAPALINNADCNENAHSATEMAHMVYDELHVECHNGVSEESIDEGPRHIILSMVKQATKGMDLHRITFPTFVLEPRSMLERITDFMSHPQLLQSTSLKSDPVHRFVDVVRYFISGWHVRPKGVKKPYNPVLGEFFRCRWGTERATPNGAFFLAEQVSHHPPVSAYIYADPDSNIVATGNFKPKSRFLGNSIMSVMNGSSHLYFTNHPGEEYVFTNPNIYARGIFFGKMQLEIGDVATIACMKTGLRAEIDFKTKGFFGGSYNNIVGKIIRTTTGEELYNICGKWTEIVTISPIARSLGRKLEQPSPMSIASDLNHDSQSKYSHDQIFFNANETPVALKLVPAAHLQLPLESQRLWHHVTTALRQNNHDTAAQEKAAIEDEQRRRIKALEAGNTAWVPAYFKYCHTCNFWEAVDHDLLACTSEGINSRLAELRRHLFEK